MPSFILTHLGSGPEPSVLRREIETSTAAEIVEAYGPVIVVSGAKKVLDEVADLARHWSIVRSRQVSAPQVGAAALGRVHRE